MFKDHLLHLQTMWAQDSANQCYGPAFYPLNNFINKNLGVEFAIKVCDINLTKNMKKILAKETLQRGS